MPASAPAGRRSTRSLSSFGRRDDRAALPASPPGTTASRKAHPSVQRSAHFNLNSAVVRGAGTSSRRCAAEGCFTLEGLPSCRRRRHASGQDGGSRSSWGQYATAASSHHSGNRAMIRRCTLESVNERMSLSSVHRVRVQKARWASRRSGRQSRLSSGPKGVDDKNRQETPGPHSTAGDRYERNVPIPCVGWLRAPEPACRPAGAAAPPRRRPCDAAPPHRSMLTGVRGGV